jgi:hypothetical protein
MQVASIERIIELQPTGHENKGRKKHKDQGQNESIQTVSQHFCPSTSKFLLAKHSDSSMMFLLFASYISIYRLHKDSTVIDTASYIHMTDVLIIITPCLTSRVRSSGTNQNTTTKLQQVDCFRLLALGPYKLRRRPLFDGHKAASCRTFDAIHQPFACMHRRRGLTVLDDGSLALCMWCPQSMHVSLIISLVQHIRFCPRSMYH